MISLEQTGNTVTLNGNLDIEGTCELFDASLKFEADTMTVDFSGVDDLDSAGLALLVYWQQRALATKGDLKIRGANGRAENLARLYGLGSLLTTS